MRLSARTSTRPPGSSENRSLISSAGGFAMKPTRKISFRMFSISLRRATASHSLSRICQPGFSPLRGTKSRIGTGRSARRRSLRQQRRRGRSILKRYSLIRRMSPTAHTGDQRFGPSSGMHWKSSPRNRKWYSSGMSLRVEASESFLKRRECRSTRCSPANDTPCFISGNGSRICTTNLKLFRKEGCL